MNAKRIMKFCSYAVPALYGIIMNPRKLLEGTKHYVGSQGMFPFLQSN